MADRFAAAGFVALAPDLYHGKTAKSPDEAGKMMMSLRIDQAAAPDPSLTVIFIVFGLAAVLVLPSLFLLYALSQRDVLEH